MTLLPKSCTSWGLLFVPTICRVQTPRWSQKLEFSHQPEYKWKGFHINFQSSKSWNRPVPAGNLTCKLKQRDLVACNRKNFWHLHALPSYHPKGEGSEAVETTDFTEDGPLFKVLEFCLSSPSLAPSKFWWPHTCLALRRDPQANASLETPKATAFSQEGHMFSSSKMWKVLVGSKNCDSNKYHNNHNHKS